MERKRGFASAGAAGLHSRRDFLRIAGLSAAAMGLVRPARAAGTRPPNFVIVFLDDSTCRRRCARPLARRF